MAKRSTTFRHTEELLNTLADRTSDIGTDSGMAASRNGGGPNIDLDTTAVSGSVATSAGTQGLEATRPWIMETMI